MEIVIRRCGPDDAAALSLVGQATFLDTFAGVLPGADILAHCRERHAERAYGGWLATPGWALWLAEAEGGAPVGYVVLGPPDLPIDTAAGDGEVKRIYVLRRFQRDGLGARLLEEVVRQARADRLSRLLLGVKADNLQAVTFYLKCGFAQAGSRKFQVGANWYDDLILARPL